MVGQDEVRISKIADALLKSGCSTISFDAPAHGKSPGNQTIMTDFIAAILEIENNMALSRLLATLRYVYLKCNKKGLKLNTAIIIGSEYSSRYY
jgi:hypothetical protein